jgi:hypothetical protein
MPNRTVPDDTIEALRAAQSSVILATLDDYLRAAPGRELRVTYDPLLGFRVRLVDQRESLGESLRDAAAQVATVLMLDSLRAAVVTVEDARARLAEEVRP